MIKTFCISLFSLFIISQQTAFGSEERGPVSIIFDTDISGDVDDALALAMLHTLADRGACEILAVTISKTNEHAAPFADAINTFYGRPDIPIGIAPDAPFRESKYLQLVEERDGGKLRYPYDLGKRKQPELAVPLLRKTLSAADDHSVSLVQVGLAVNIADLLKSQADAYSPLDGKALIAKKVKLLSVMAGSFQTIGDNNRYLEANVRFHVASMQKLAADWPSQVPIFWSGFEIGIAATFPRESVAQDFEYFPKHIIKEAYLLHSGPDHDRPTWDLTSVLYAVYPDRKYFGLSSPGRVTVEDDGYTRFDSAFGRYVGSSWKQPNVLDTVPIEKKRDHFLTMSPEQAARVQEALTQMATQPPSKKSIH